MSGSDRINVMIVDDHSIVRIGLKQALEQSVSLKWSDGA